MKYSQVLTKKKKTRNVTEDDNDYDPEYGLYNSRDNEGENDDPWADEDRRIKADQDKQKKTSK